MNPIDYQRMRLLQPVVLFDRLEMLQSAIEFLRGEKFIVHEFDCAEHASQEGLFNAVLHALGILAPNAFYRDIKVIQFWDLLCEAQSPAESGIILAFRNFDDFQRRHPKSGQGLLESIAQEHFHQLYRGLRFVAWVHSDDRVLERVPIYTIRARRNEFTRFGAEYETFNRRCNALLEALKAAQKHLAPRLTSRNYYELEKALRQVTGAADLEALMEMGLNETQIIDLLHDFDFASLPSPKPRSRLTPG